MKSVLDRILERPAMPSAVARRCLLAALGLLLPQRMDAGAAANPPIDLTADKREWGVSLRWENDAFGKTDRWYTDGVAIGLSHTGPSWLDPVINWLPWGEGRHTVGYEVAQAMFTPSNKDLNPPDPNDRPYAGILAVSLTAYVDRTNSFHALKFTTGVVGPASLAEQTQDTVHSLIGDGKPAGWDHQLKNEPILDLAYEYRYKFHLLGQHDEWSVETLPVAGGWLGNMLTQGQIGGLLRTGYNLPDDFGPSLVRGMGFMPPPRHDALRPSRSDWGFSVYGGAFANFVLRDITLDGNTFADSPSVDKKFFVPAAGVGASVGNRHIQASFSFVLWGEEFHGQAQDSKFGSVGISYFF